MNDTIETGPDALTLVAVTNGVARGIRIILPRYSAAILVEIRSEWQVLAQRGPTEITGAWSVEIADQVHARRAARHSDAQLIAPFRSFDQRALLVLSAEAGDRVALSALRIVRPLLDAGGLLLDRAVAAQERDRALRRVLPWVPRAQPTPRAT